MVRIGMMNAGGNMSINRKQTNVFGASYHTYTVGSSNYKPLANIKRKRGNINNVTGNINNVKITESQPHQKKNIFYLTQNNLSNNIFIEESENNIFIKEDIFRINSNIF